MVSIRLIIQTSQCGSLIGKGGSRIKEIREVSLPPLYYYYYYYYYYYNRLQVLVFKLLANLYQTQLKEQLLYQVREGERERGRGGLGGRESERVI